jgi:hypothetical protein
VETSSPRLPVGRPDYERMMKMDTTKQIEALEDLFRFYGLSMLHGCETITHRQPKHPDAMAIYKEATEELSAWGTQIVAAQAQLLRTGFPVPDSWLKVDAMGTIKCGAEKAKGKTVYFVQIAGPDTNALGAICDEIRIAMIRLQCTPQQDDSKPLTDSQQDAYDLIAREGPLQGNQIVKRLGIPSESSFTAHYVPALKQHGVKNRRGRGYYIDPPPTV